MNRMIKHYDIDERQYFLNYLNKMLRNEFEWEPI